MRDLAQSWTFGRRKVSRAKILLVIGLVVAVGVALSFLGTNSLSSGGGGSVILADAPPDMQPVALGGEAMVTEAGVDLKTETARMKDLRGGASATVTRTYGAGVYKLSITATLPDPKNVSYAVWLVGDDGPILLDYMRGSGTSWSLSLSGPDKYSALNGVMISLERTKDSLVEEKVMEGSF